MVHPIIEIPERPRYLVGTHLIIVGPHSPYSILILKCEAKRVIRSRQRRNISSLLGYQLSRKPGIQIEQAHHRRGLDRHERKFLSPVSANDRLVEWIVS